MRATIHYTSLALVFILGFMVPAALGRYYIAVGEGPDEIAHLDHVFFRYTRPSSTIQVGRGLTVPGLAPQGQGHQPPLFYDLSSALLPLWLPVSAVGPFWDYQIGIWYSSFASYTHGKPSCEFRAGDPPGGRDGELLRNAVLRLRSTNALLLPLSVLFTYLAARLVFRGRPTLWLACAALYAGTPTAVWRSSFITNDNLVSALGSLVFLLCVFYVTRTSVGIALVIITSLAAAAAFLTKYTGAVGLAVLLAAVLLRRGTGMTTRLVHAVVACTVFAVCIAPELLHNLQVEGEPFLTGVVAHEFPFLYKPSSLAHVLFESDFLPVLLGRIWLEYYNLGVLDEYFALWKVYVWWGLSGAAVLGLAMFLFRPRLIPEADWRPLALAGLSFLAAVALVVHFAVSFPLPGGRYLHTMLTPVALLVVTGIVALARCITAQRFADLTTLMVVFVFAGFGWHTTFSYQAKRFGGCSAPVANDVEGGLAFDAGDVDADGIDEIFVYHRHPSRMFLLKREGGAYRLRPDWTRAFGLQGDHFLLGDVTGDRKEDVVIHRPNQHGVFILDATNITAHNQSLSPFSDRAVEFMGTWLDKKRIHYSSRMVLGELGGSTGKELLVYNPRTAEWRTYTLNEWPSGRVITPYADILKFGGSRKSPFTLPKKATELLGVHDAKSGTVYVGAFHDKQSRAAFRVPPQQSLLVLDANADGLGDIVTWPGDSNCVTLRVSAEEAGVIRLAGDQRICLRLGPDEFRLTTHHAVFGVTPGPGLPDALAAGDKRTGIVTLFPLLGASSHAEAVTVQGTQADPGFLRADERVEPFDP